MAGMMMKVLCLMVAFMVISAPYAEALTCGDVSSKLASCVNYLRGGGQVSAACCNGVKGLKSEAQTTADKKTACNCMKSAYRALSGIKPNNALTLPSKCGVSIPYKISLDTNCNTLK